MGASAAGSLASGGFTVAGLFVDNMLGDGHVKLTTSQATNIKWNCDRNPQLRQVCPWEPLSPGPIAQFQTKTYAFTPGLGYVSQSFSLTLLGYYDGCDLMGVCITLGSDYSQSLIGRKGDWEVVCTPLQSPMTGASGCSDCCPECAVVEFNVLVTTGGFVCSLLVTVNGNGTWTKQRI